MPCLIHIGSTGDISGDAWSCGVFFLFIVACACFIIVKQSNKNKEISELGQKIAELAEKLKDKEKRKD